QRILSTWRINMKLAGAPEGVHHRGEYLVRRQRLMPGGGTPWDRDPFYRVAGGLEGGFLSIEVRHRGGGQTRKDTSGEVDWVEPSDRIHRALNVGREVFEEVVTFFLDRPDAEPQPEAESQ